ncbi:nodulation protein [Verminephrobacter aporrectodeae subsp. tuberculatae]|uniref:efflux RND transporter permease subunit n=1 Tax=Verminephrobacter aporrectodeae TaxID=1110389 RepID=UPI002238176A|nr:efflux RND transporter permease subunit [Verminephrobacter aporrectodeae]MCW5221217.1 nodulation protein [Verminephrobacter aporrectodeae subsp. tuberculatae]MCW5254976.1 nodulation protein [Verminephrobacter aporrectodeae subsp. tuberculatae]MCW5290508.1 nodulation protein [Verminephrobacter aporrectodeae subsp. tuberculatae]MCW8199339.1 nodulation protein [Verminephrobacter aporrectodeae subsp. tuberculatae]
MNLSRPFVERPVATVLLTLGVALAGIAAFFVLPVSPLPQVDYPSISVSANLPGASPETMAASVVTPLERRLGLIAGVNEMTSVSSNGSARVSLQFDLERNIDAAARAVQAAINAARADLPATLRNNPGYRKRNPAAAPVMILALTSKTRSTGAIYDAVSNVVSQRLSQVDGVGEVEIGGGSLPAVRVELLPFALDRYGISTEDVRAAIQAANARRPQGVVEGNGRRLQIYTPEPARVAAQYAALVIAWRNDAAVRLGDVARVEDGVENNRTVGLFNGAPAIIVLVTRQPGANAIETVDAVRALLPDLQAQLPQDIQVAVASDSTHSIRASLHEIEFTLLLSIALVVLVVALFLRQARATVIPALATVVSLLGTFGVMHLLGFSLNNLSLMALTVATGFVIDDAIVVLENTMRHVEAGMARMQAALQGAREVGPTVLSISLSLVAVFIPLLFMDGQMGRLFREFAVTLSAAVLISLLLSLTTTPMLCAWLLRAQAPGAAPGRWALRAERGYQMLLRGYARGLDWALANQALVLLLLLAVTGLNVYLFARIPKGYFPQQDNGQINAGLRADQSISSQALARKLRQAVDTIRHDPAVDTVVGFSGGSRAGGGFMFVNLKPPAQRSVSTPEVVARLRPQLNQITGLRVFLNPVQELRMGARESNSSYQYTLKSDNLADLRRWAGRLADRLKDEPLLQDVDTDQAENGVQTRVEVDRARATQLGASNAAIGNALYNAFGQRPVATIHDALNQYSVIMEWAPEYTRGPLALQDVRVAANPDGTTGSAANPGQRAASTGQVLSTTASTMVPLSAMARMQERAAPSSISHQDGELATTISFNLPPDATLDQAQAAIAQAQADITMPSNVRGSFQGSALSAQRSQGQQMFLIGAAIVVIYLVLGMLYESLIHPLTVLSTLPSAGVGAVLALLLFDMPFGTMALIGVLLLIGIVKKNAIMVIDFALEAERARSLTAQQAVRAACLLRFRPILMTTLAAALGALPLAIGFGQGSGLRQPLGVAIIGGLLISQLLTLLTTPVVYVLLDRLRRPAPDERHLSRTTP